MQKIFILLFLFLGINKINGQSYSVSIDSLTKVYIKKLPKETQKKFDKILKQRVSVDFSKRVDTAKCDYVFLEEIYCESNTTIQIFERYFYASDSTLDNYYDKNNRYVKVPSYSYYNGLPYASQHGYFSHSVAQTFFDHVYEYYYTLDTLLYNHRNIKPVQELSYDKTVSTFDISDTSITKKTELEEKLKLKLLKTYKVISIIDYKQKKVFVSVQLPPSHPQVEYRFIEPLHYDW